jgi:preprotein translocase subunit YajC
LILGHPAATQPIRNDKIMLWHGESAARQPMGGAVCNPGVAGYSPPTVQTSGEFEMLISPAFAQAAGGSGGAFDYMTLLPLVLIFVIFYFLLIRPQQAKAKQHKAMIDGIRRGDIITTAGGLIGKVVRILDDGTAQVEIAENVRVRIVRATIAEVRVKGEPAEDSGASAKADNGDKKAASAGKK